MCLETPTRAAKSPAGRPLRQPGVEDEQTLLGRQGLGRLDRLAQRFFSVLTAAGQQW